MSDLIRHWHQSPLECLKSSSTDVWHETPEYDEDSKHVKVLLADWGITLELGPSLSNILWREHVDLGKRSATTFPPLPLRKATISLKNNASQHPSLWGICTIEVNLFCAETLVANEKQQFGVKFTNYLGVMSMIGAPFWLGVWPVRGLGFWPHREPCMSGNQIRGNFL